MTSLVCPKSGESYKDMDKVSKEKRSEIMRRVRSSDSVIEFELRALLRSHGLRYRKNVAKLFGKPDIVFKKTKLVVFVDSCFWHGCKRHGRIPSSNRTYWEQKIHRNRLRDTAVNRYYKKSGWSIFRVWEHDLRAAPNEVADKIVSLYGR